MELEDAGLCSFIGEHSMPPVSRARYVWRCRPPVVRTNYLLRLQIDLVVLERLAPEGDPLSGGLPQTFDNGSLHWAAA
jgi:hypothetical protein